VKQIIYISTARNAFPDAAMIRSVLEVSRRNNARDGLTGLLLVGGRRFLQVLEGPEAALEIAFARIRADERPLRLSSFAPGPSNSAAFRHGRWAMRKNRKHCCHRWSG
jgi:hypothetical protein